MLSRVTICHDMSRYVTCHHVITCDVRQVCETVARMECEGVEKEACTTMREERCSPGTETVGATCIITVTCHVYHATCHDVLSRCAWTRWSRSAASCRTSSAGMSPRPGQCQCQDRQYPHTILLQV